MGKLILLGGLLVPLAVLISLATIYFRYNGGIFEFVEVTENGETVDTTLELEIGRAFKDADGDSSGTLTFEEFQAAVQRLLKVGLHGGINRQEAEKQLTKDQSNYVELIQRLESSFQPESLQGEGLPLRVKFEPFVFKSLSKYKDGTHNDYNSQIHLSGLKNWRSPNIVEGILPAENFSVLLPPKAIGFEVGQPWYLVEDGGDSLNNDHYRYYTREPETKEERLIITLLSMFHPRPFLNLRFGPRGVICNVRAYNHELVDIVFRVHAEFQMNEPPRYPFWYTPGQFAGRIIMTKDAKSIKYFNLYLPSTEKLNIDMEWITGKKTSKNPDDQWQMEVDIGYQPELAIVSNGSMPVNGDYQPPVDIDQIEWLSEIRLDEARYIIDKEFYPFRKVPYLKFNDTFRTAQKQDKLVHSIVLWGTLDNQAC